MITEFKNKFSIVLLLMLTACQPMPKTDESSTVRNYEFLNRQGQKYWEQRHEEKQARTAYMFFKRASEIQADNIELLTQLSRTCHFIGHFIETDQAKRDSLFAEGMNYGEKALFLSEEFSAAYENATGNDNIRKISAIGATSPDLVSSLYWWSANLGRFMAYKPVMERLEYQELVETALHRVQALEPDYLYGATNRFFGALYARIPGIDLSQSREYFDLAVEKHPDYLGTYTLRAEFYHTKAGNRELFHQDLMRVIDADPTVLPDIMPENLLEQSYARRLLDKEHLLFE